MRTTAALFVVTGFSLAATDKDELTEAEAWQIFAERPHPGARKMATEALAAQELHKRPLDNSQWPDRTAIQS